MIREWFDRDVYIGEIYSISNRSLGIPLWRGGKHPGAILGEGSSLRRALVSKGTDEANVKDYWRDYYVIVNPDTKNCLKKSTAFSTRATETSIVATQPERKIGELSDEDLRHLLLVIDLDK